MVGYLPISKVINWMDSEEGVDNKSDQFYGRYARDVPNARWVGIGASAGGLEAIRSFTRELSAEHEATYIIAQHMVPQQESLLSEIIRRETALTVVEATDNLRPRLGTVYITPPNHDIAIENSRIRLRTARAPLAAPKPSVDLLLTTLALEKKDKAIGIIFSGTGSDGSKGIVEVRNAGGITVAQDEHTSEYLGMPQAAMKTGAIDVVISPELLGAQFGVLVATPRDLSALALPPVSAEGLAALNNLLYQQTNVDFSDYKIGTVQRRIDRRIAAVGATNLHEYVEIARGSEQEVNELFKDLLITVTSFFRDPEEFEGLSIHIKKMVQDEPTAMRRVWIAGVATGEEAYTIAIIFAEAFGGLKHFGKANFQIFATDIDEEALDIARKGFYAEKCFANISEHYIKSYFDEVPGGYTARKTLREKLVFSIHNVATDPPFLSIDVVSCRNLLIYFQPNLQAQVFERFHYALKDHGLLFLGNSEAVVASQSLFKAAAPEKHLFFQKPSLKRRIRSNSAVPAALAEESVDDIVAHNEPDDDAMHQLETLIATLGPNALVLDEHLNIVRVYGDLDYFSSLSQGSSPGYAPTNSINSWIKKPWSQDIRVAVPGVFRKRKSYNGLTRTDAKDKSLVSRVQIYPLDDGAHAQRLALVTFKLWAKTSVTAGESASCDREITLERTVEEPTHELEISKTILQTTIEELETSKEQLQVLNEELQSNNEELLSTNQELKKSNEELQLTNKELITEKKELQVNVQQLNSINQSMISVLENMQTPLLVVDKNLIIINASKSAAEEFKIDLLLAAPSIFNCEIPEGMPEIAPITMDVLASGKRNEVAFERGFMCQSISVTPFNNVNGDVLGAIVQVVDKSPTPHRMQNEFSALMENMSVCVLDTDADGMIYQINENFCTLLGIRKVEALGANYYSLLHPDTQAYMLKTDKNILQSKQPVFAQTEKVRFANGQVVPLKLNRIPIKIHNTANYRVLTIAEMITQNEPVEA